MEADTQEQKILTYLKSGRSLTPIAALRLFGTFRLASRVFNIKKKLEGTQYKIVNIGETRGKKTFARYVLRKK